ncbi:GNAT family acetyltransferase [Bacillus safensis]|uniref:GNAT family acetyltransferase n=1 Tax=Bacillus safensis TaxID=561879 RepID=UPI001BADDBE7|nr:GNAT family acetyltransferase [Bacillus safensis]MBR0607488.1 GNAT family acetyltransferase [Bacillus safensis]WJE39816.1 GNAT family acetyltransferase [Bacillus safensis]
MEICEFSIKEYDDVVRVWKSAGLVIGRSDSQIEIKKKLLRDPELFLVAKVKEQLIGAVIGGFDGRRGWIHHLAVDPNFQKQNIGKKLLKEVEKRLYKLGAIKINLLVLPDNKVTDFYENLGYNYGSKPILMEKWIENIEY